MDLPSLEQIAPHLTERGQVEVDLALARMQVKALGEEVRMLRQALEQHTEEVTDEP